MVFFAEPSHVTLLVGSSVCLVAPACLSSSARRAGGPSDWPVCFGVPEVIWCCVSAAGAAGHEELGIGAWWCSPSTPALWEAEAVGLQAHAQARQLNDLGGSGDTAAPGLCQHLAVPRWVTAEL